MSWYAVCSLDQVPVGRAVCVLVRDEQVALFRTAGGSLHALDNRDPVSGAMVLARGIVGTRGGRDVVSSPMFKQAFDLVTGECLDLDGVQVDVHEVAVHGGFLAVRLA